MHRHIVRYRNHPSLKGLDQFLKVTVEYVSANEATYFTQDLALAMAAEFRDGGDAHLDAEVVSVIPLSEVISA